MFGGFNHIQNNPQFGRARISRVINLDFLTSLHCSDMAALCQNIAHRIHVWYISYIDPIKINQMWVNIPVPWILWGSAVFCWRQGLGLVCLATSSCLGVWDVDGFHDDALPLFHRWLYCLWWNTTPGANHSECGSTVELVALHKSAMYRIYDTYDIHIYKLLYLTSFIYIYIII